MFTTIRERYILWTWLHVQHYEPFSKISNQWNRTHEATENMDQEFNENKAQEANGENALSEYDEMFIELNSIDTNEIEASRKCSPNTWTFSQRNVY